MNDTVFKIVETAVEIRLGKPCFKVTVCAESDYDSHYWATAPDYSEAVEFAVLEMLRQRRVAA